MISRTKLVNSFTAQVSHSSSLLCRSVLLCRRNVMITRTFSQQVDNSPSSSPSPPSPSVSSSSTSTTAQKVSPSSSSLSSSAWTSSNNNNSGEDAREKMQKEIKRWPKAYIPFAILFTILDA
eukprot:TRINITY_DN4241_c3_g1_i1.p1 TRINITY_DN4241_c3_g1~~TRINITY_DN4241_c3_g1_i1.p1  ORF type:complete len:122 (-),score=44.67 TRINITY_DN4241_c3_g1_i1:175-540(-)